MLRARTGSLPIRNPNNNRQIWVDESPYKFDHRIGDRPQDDHFADPLHCGNGNETDQHECEQCAPRTSDTEYEATVREEANADSASNGYKLYKVSSGPSIDKRARSYEDVP